MTDKFNAEFAKRLTEISQELCDKHSNLGKEQLMRSMSYVLLSQISNFMDELDLDDLYIDDNISDFVYEAQRIDRETFKMCQEMTLVIDGILDGQEDNVISLNKPTVH